MKDHMDHPSHDEQLVALRRIEGQIRGIQKMINEKRYCVDILTQLHSVIGAIQSVESNILHKHLQGCFTNALKGNSVAKRNQKIEEVIGLISKFRKTT